LQVADFANLAEGLSAAHSRGVTHRDLKPENIFLTGDGVIKILDFGLARYTPVSSSQAADAVPTETETGRVMGTVGYMSPEQIRSEPVDARSDIFSLGCVLYELFSGRRAFAGHSPGDTLAATLKEDPSPLSDPDIQRVIAHCLEKKPAARFQTVRDLIFVLRSLPATAARRRAPRRGVSSPIESLAVLPFLNVASDPNLDYLIDGVPEALTNTLAQQPKLRVIPRSRAFRYKDPEFDPVQAGRELGVHAVLTGRVALRGESLNIQVELVDVAEDSHLWGEQFTRRITEIQAIQDEITRAVVVKLRLQPAGEATRRAARNYTENTEAYQLYLKGRFYGEKRTVGMLKKAAEMFVSFR
jgi:serine/threonine protein kinase